MTSLLSSPLYARKSPRPGGLSRASNMILDAFEHVNAGNRTGNFVALADMRSKLPQLSREVFDAALRELRSAGVLGASSLEGGGYSGASAVEHARLRQGGVPDEGSSGSGVLSHVSRKGLLSSPLYARKSQRRRTGFLVVKGSSGWEPGDGRPPVVTVDLDGTLAEDAGSGTPLAEREPKEGAAEGVARMRSAGIWVIVWTANDEGEDKVREWLERWDIGYDDINNNKWVEDPDSTRKIRSDAYLDDKAIPTAGKDWDELAQEAIIEVLGKARQPIDEEDGYDELAELAEKAYPELETLLDNLGFRTVRIEGLELGEFEAEIRKPGGVVVIAPMKEYKRAKEKVEADYGGNWRKLLDMVRAAVAVETIGEIAQAQATLREAGATMARPPKDRFKEPLANGYRDLLCNYRLPSGLICEVQFHLKPMLIAREREKVSYDVARAIKASMEEEGRKDYTPAESEAIRRARKASEHIFARAWEECQAKEGREKLWKGSWIKAFCPTGAGGGIDPTCGSEGGEEAVTQNQVSTDNVEVESEKPDQSKVSVALPKPEELKNQILTAAKTDSDLKGAVKHRLLGYCDPVARLLQGHLASQGITTREVQGRYAAATDAENMTIGGNHYWLETEDGTIIDPTEVQFQVRNDMKVGDVSVYPPTSTRRELYLADDYMDWKGSQKFWRGFALKGSPLAVVKADPNNLKIGDTVWFLSHKGDVIDFGEYSDVKARHPGARMAPGRDVDESKLRGRCWAIRFDDGVRLVGSMGIRLLLNKKNLPLAVRKYITHDGDEWTVRAESGRVLGTHDTRAEAVAQLAAVEANKEKDETVMDVAPEYALDPDIRVKGAFREDEHPRDEGGEFTAGGSDGKKPKTSNNETESSPKKPETSRISTVQIGGDKVPVDENGKFVDPFGMNSQRSRVPKVGYHVTGFENLESIAREGLRPYVSTTGGGGGGKVAGVYFADKPNMDVEDVSEGPKEDTDVILRVDTSRVNGVLDDIEVREGEDKYEARRTPDKGTAFIAGQTLAPGNIKVGINRGGKIAWVPIGEYLNKPAELKPKQIEDFAAPSRQDGEKLLKIMNKRGYDNVPLPSGNTLEIWSLSLTSSETPKVIGYEIDSKGRRESRFLSKEEIDYVLSLPKKPKKTVKDTISDRLKSSPLYLAKRFDSVPVRRPKGKETIEQLESSLWAVRGADGGYVRIAGKWQWTSRADAEAARASRAERTPVQQDGGDSGLTLSGSSQGTWVMDGEPPNAYGNDGAKVEPARVAAQPDDVIGPYDGTFLMDDGRDVGGPAPKPKPVRVPRQPKDVVGGYDGAFVVTPLKGSPLTRSK